MTNEIVKRETEAIVPDAKNLLILAEQLYKSGMFPSVKSPAGALATIEYGRELGVPPVASLQTIAVVNGRLCMEAKLMQALAEKNGVKVTILEKTKAGAKVRLEKAGKEPFIESFSIEDAKALGFLTKQNWKSYPEEMCYCRCIAKGIRAYDPGSIMGLYSKEEMLDVTDEFKNPGGGTEPGEVEMDDTEEGHPMPEKQPPTQVATPRTFPIKLTTGTVIEVTDKTILPYFQAIKKKMAEMSGSDDTYYGILKAFGYQKSRFVPAEKMREVWEAMKESYLKLVVGEQDRKKDGENNLLL